MAGHGHDPTTRHVFIDLKDDPHENGPTLADERTTLVELALSAAHIGEEMLRSR